MIKFDRRTGDYVAKNDPLGRGADTLMIPLPGRRILDDSEPFNLASRGHWSDVAHRDWEIIRDGSPEPLTCPWILGRLAEMDVDPRSAHQLSRARRGAICDALVRAARRDEDRRMLRLGQTVTRHAGTSMSDIESLLATERVPGARLSDVLLTGRDKDLFELDENGTRITVAAVRHLLMESYDLTPEQFVMLSDEQQTRIRHRILRAARRLIRDQAALDERQAELRRERTDLHVSLRAWARGALTLEHPSGSSLHHLLDYDSGSRRSEDDLEFKSFVNSADMQIILVENDWASAVPSHVLGEEWPPLPFEKCCWEFRVSGVRVLAFTHAEPADDPLMFCVYGRGGQWVIDDYSYRLGQGATRRDERIAPRGETCEFPAVARLVTAGIRASCIMMDAGICEQEHVPAPRRLAERRVSEKKSPLRDHYVVSLLRRHRRDRVARSAGAGTGGGHRQRGHWRPGRWMHFDRQDAGKIQYVNDGGFFVSKTWQRWHFAGDENNIIHKEYRL